MGNRIGSVERGSIGVEAHGREHGGRPERPARRPGGDDDRVVEHRRRSGTADPRDQRLAVGGHGRRWAAEAAAGLKRVEGLRRTDPALAVRWRFAVRNALEPLLAGGSVAGFSRGGSYLVRPGAGPA